MFLDVNALNLNLESHQKLIILSKKSNFQKSGEMVVSFKFFSQERAEKLKKYHFNSRIAVFNEKNKTVIILSDKSSLAGKQVNFQQKNQIRSMKVVAEVASQELIQKFREEIEKALAAQIVPLVVIFPPKEGKPSVRRTALEIPEVQKPAKTRHTQAAVEGKTQDKLRSHADSRLKQKEDQRHRKERQKHREEFLERKEKSQIEAIEKRLAVSKSS